MPSPETAQPFQFNLAPEHLWQAINPWTWNVGTGQVGLVNISLGHSGDDELERRVLDEVGSYGRQIGHLGEALEVLIKYADTSRMSQDERDALAIVEGEVARIRRMKETRGR